MRLLVAYASRKGSTHETAEFIADVLSENGLNVDVLPMEQVRSLNEYHAIIFGSPVYQGSWLAEAFKFMGDFKEDLAVKPCYVWTHCIRILEPTSREHVLTYYVPSYILQKLNVLDSQVFAGCLQNADISPDERWSLALHYDGELNPYNLDNDFRPWAQYISGNVAKAVDIR